MPPQPPNPLMLSNPAMHHSPQILSIAFVKPWRGSTKPYCPGPQAVGRQTNHRCWSLGGGGEAVSPLPRSTFGEKGVNEFIRGGEDITVVQGRGVLCLCKGRRSASLFMHNEESLTAKEQDPFCMSDSDPNSLAMVPLALHVVPVASHLGSTLFVLPLGFAPQFPSSSRLSQLGTSGSADRWRAKSRAASSGDLAATRPVVA